MTNGKDKKEQFLTWWRTKTSAFIVKNILVAAAICFVIVIVVVSWLKKYTEHGIEVDVPEVIGLTIDEADILVADAGLVMEVVDSTYSHKVPLGTIVEQNPPAYSHAKNGRIIYVVVNARTRKQIVVPELRDMSIRQVESTLRQLGLVVGDIEYEPSEFRDLVLDLKQGGVSIEPGKRVSESSSITIVVGRGLGTEMVIVPDLRGQSLQDARACLLNSQLIIGAYDYDVEPTEENEAQYMVYQQSPEAGTRILEGSIVNISMSSDPEKVVTANNEKNEESFF